MASLGSILAMNTRADTVECGDEQGFKRDTDEVAGRADCLWTLRPGGFFLHIVRDNGGQGIGYQAVLHQQEECYEHH